MISVNKERYLIENYKKEVAFVSAHNGDVDEGVAMDMIKHEFYAYKGVFGRKHKYVMPEDFDWAAFEKDYNK